MAVNNGFAILCESLFSEKRTRQTSVDGIDRLYFPLTNEAASEPGKRPRDPFSPCCILVTQNIERLKQVDMTRTSRAMIVGAAMTGLLTGSLAVRTYAASASSKVGVSMQTVADDQKGKHGCKGQNECKGQGGCKTGDNGCKGKNSCKGKGGCKASESSCKGKNGCSLQRL